MIMNHLLQAAPEFSVDILSMQLPSAMPQAPQEEYSAMRLSYIAIGTIVLGFLLIVWAYWPNQGTLRETMRKQARSDSVKDLEIISREEAIQDSVDIPSGVEAIVTLKKERMESIVTFPAKLPERTLGSGYYVQIVMDARDGGILERKLGRRKTEPLGTE